MSNPNKDEDWIPIRQQNKIVDTDEVRVSILPRKSEKLASVTISFRDNVRGFIGERSHADISIGGEHLNRIKIDLGHRGEFKIAHTGWQKRGCRLRFSTPLWASHVRAAAATYEKRGNSLVLTLPVDWAKASIPKETQPTPNVAPVVRPADQHGRTAISPPQRSPHVIPMSGEPPPGRSALDQRRGT